MPSEAELESLEDSILSNAAAPSYVSIDGHAVNAHDPLKLIEVHDRLQSNNAAAGTKRGLVITRLKPGGTV